jgi:hypothetical protein
MVDGYILIHRIIAYKLSVVTTFVSCFRHLYKLQHVHKYNVFELTTEEQLKSSAFARDLIQVLSLHGWPVYSKLL